MFTLQCNVSAAAPAAGIGGGLSFAAARSLCGAYGRGWDIASVTTMDVHTALNSMHSTFTSALPSSVAPTFVTTMSEYYIGGRMRSEPAAPKMDLFEWVGGAHRHVAFYDRQNQQCLASPAAAAAGGARGYCAMPTNTQPVTNGEWAVSSSTAGWRFVSPSSYALGCVACERASCPASSQQRQQQAEEKGGHAYDLSNRFYPQCTTTAEPQETLTEEASRSVSRSLPYNSSTASVGNPTDSATGAATAW